MVHLDTEKLIDFLSDPLVNKSEVASALYGTEISKKEISRETARKRLFTKLSHNVHFSRDELKRLTDICFDLQRKLNSIKFQSHEIFEGHYATNGNLEFRIVNYDVALSTDVKVVGLNGELFTVQQKDIEPVYLDDQWVKRLGLKKDIVIKKEQHRQWKLKKLGSHYYLAGEFPSGNENPVLSLHTVHELQYWYEAITGTDLFVKRANPANNS